MVARKGMMLGKGSGYKNVIGKDPMVHSQSAKGIKQPQVRYIKPLNLGKVNKLPIQVGVIVPSTNLNKTIPTIQFNKRINETKKFFDKTFGGDTSVKTIGSYWDGKKLIKEKGLLVESSMSIETYNKKKDLIETFIKDKHKEWNQDTILVSVEGQNFIYPYKDYIDNDEKQKQNILVS